MRDGLCVGCLCGPQFSVGVSDAQSLRHRCYHFKMKYKDTFSVIVIFFFFGSLCGCGSVSVPGCLKRKGHRFEYCLCSPSTAEHSELLLAAVGEYDKCVV